MADLPPRAQVLRDDSRGSRRLYRIEFEDADGTRHRVEDYWSVTTLLKGMPNRAMPYWSARETAQAALDELDYWRDEVAKWGVDETRKKLADTPWRKSGKKADVGTIVHAQIEARILGAEPPPVADEHRAVIAPYMEQFERFCADHKPDWLAAELTVVNRSHRWAGTLDAIAKIDGRTLTIDAKTTKPAGRMEDQPGIWLEHACQIAAYRRGEIGIDKTGNVHPVPETDGGAALWLNPTRYALLELDTSDAVYRLFRLAAEVYLAVDTQRTGWFIIDDLKPPATEGKAA